MGEDRVDIPISFWERLVSDKRRLALVGGGVLAVLLVVSWALLAGPLSRGDSEWGGAGPIALDPIEESGEVSGTTTPEGSETTSRTTDAEADGDGGSGDGEPGSEDPEFVRAPLIAYRFDKALWVAGEDGSGAQRVASSAAGAYSLSPDGLILAWVDSAAHLLHLSDVKSARNTVIGPAEDVRPGWSPDSKFVAYTGVADSHLQVRTVTAHGTGDRLLGDGHSPSVGSDGRVVFVASVAPGAMGPVAVTDARGNPTELSVVANAVAFGGDGLVWATSGSVAGSERIMTSRQDGGSPRELIGGSAQGKPVSYTMLCVSPDGDSLFYGVSGDDGFSRAYVSPLAQPGPVSLTVRRDTYPHVWSADGGRVFFFEGNAFQGETPALLRSDTSGFGRVVVVQGAGL